MALLIDHREMDSSTAVISLSGKIMLGREASALETLVPELVAKGYSRLIFDMTNVSQIDSTGIGRFIQAYNQVSKVKGKLVIAAAPGHVRDSFHVTRLDTVFKFFPDVEAAYGAVRV